MSARRLSRVVASSAAPSAVVSGPVDLPVSQARSPSNSSLRAESPAVSRRTNESRSAGGNSTAVENNSCSRSHLESIPELGRFISSQWCLLAADESGSEPTLSLAEDPDQP